MKNLVTLLAICLATNPLFAQFENFDLSKYKLPDIKRHELTFQLTQNGTADKLNNDENEIERNLDFVNNFDGYYNYFLSTRKHQTSLYSSISHDFNSEKFKEDSHTTKNNQSSSNIFASYVDRIYFSEDKLFFHLNPYMSYYTNKRVQATPHSYAGQWYDMEFIHQSSSVSPEFKVGLGLGRIEPVGDVRHAIYVVEDLEKNNRLTKTPTEQEIYRIATKFSELKNKRFFDSRHRMIYEIKSIDSLLFDMGLVKEQDAVYFTSIYDFWNHGNESRSSGTTFQFDIITGLNYHFSKTINDSYSGSSNSLERYTYKGKSHEEYVGISFVFQNEKPIKLKWQRFYSSSISLKHHFYDTDNLNSNRLNQYFSSGIQWFMNTRTNASILISEDFQYNISDNDGPNRKTYYLGINLNGILNYYISPRLRVTVRPGLACYHSKNNQKETTLRFNNNLQINYSIF